VGFAPSTAIPTQPVKSTSGSTHSSTAARNQPASLVQMASGLPTSRAWAWFLKSLPMTY
jgi:hypothetical protein